jgi:hypothetical protein
MTGAVVAIQRTFQLETAALERESSLLTFLVSFSISAGYT